MKQDNLNIYNALSETPKEARKTIGAGKLKGMTDINPMWRIKRMTEVFGPQGDGWKTEVVDMRAIDAGGESMAHTVLALYYKKSDGSWSEPIYGVGGAKLAGKGVGDGINDEAFKMSFTDALGICMKGLGMSSDIYFEKDRTKYSSVSDDSSASDDEAAIKKEIEGCKTKQELAKLYNEKYGGNAGASAYVKRLTQARLTELDNA